MLEYTYFNAVNKHMNFGLKSKISNLLVVVLFVLISSCQKSNPVPFISFEISDHGLEVDLSGSISGALETVAGVEIHWGDSDISYLSKEEFILFTKRHVYKLPRTYTIMIHVLDINGIMVFESKIVNVGYLPTSLLNIDNEFFIKKENEFNILTINLHTYQEMNQNQKLNYISDIIAKLDIDFVAFQECAQSRYAPSVYDHLKKDNMALIILDNLSKNYGLEYNLVWDYAHYGWQTYEEGVAMISKHQLIDSANKIISKSTSKNDITTRNVVYGNYITSKFQFNMFSTHLHWRTSYSDEEQNNQIKVIKQMVNEKENSNNNVITFVCGDFNCNPTSDFPYSEGYKTMIDHGAYLDTYLVTNEQANSLPSDPKYHTVGGAFPGRIDYIFLKKNDRVKIKASQIIFNDKIVGKVSDHYGVLTKFEVN